MDVCLAIKQRLEELELEQRELAVAAEVTESYISQLLTRKKLPPAPDRTDIYDKMERFLRLPSAKLSKLAGDQRKEELKRNLGSQPVPLLEDVRELILRKCSPDKEKEVRAIFEKQPFGELERLVAQKLLDVARRVAQEELESDSWLRLMAQLIGRSYEQMRVMVLEFLDTDVFNLSIGNCDSFLDPLIESWDIDLATFSMQIILNRRLATGNRKQFEFAEKDVVQASEDEPGFKRCLRNALLSGDISEEEMDFLKGLRLGTRKPTALYFYRELQNLRDPLHFQGSLPMRPARQPKAARPIALLPTTKPGANSPKTRNGKSRKHKLSRGGPK